MRVKTVSYRRNSEVAPFCHEHAECMIELSEGDDPEVAFLAAKTFVENKLGAVPPAPPRRRTPKDV